MILFIAPAQTLDFDTPTPDTAPDPTRPKHLKEAEPLMAALQAWSKEELSAKMGLSQTLTDTVYGQHQDWTRRRHNLKRGKPAIFAFQGTTYKGFQAETLSPEALVYAQDHLRILSGLYGALRPLDLILPYRLEMKIRLENPAGSALYPYWKDKITRHFNTLLKRSNSDTVISLASNEYVKAIDSKALKGRIIAPQFKDWKGDDLKQISVFSKEMRGRVARALIEQQITDPERLKSLEINGYRFDPSRSSDTDWLFVR